MTSSSSNVSSSTRRLGELLADAGLIRNDQIAPALAEAGSRNIRIGDVLVLLKQLTTAELECALEVQSLLNSGEMDAGSAIGILQICSSRNMDVPAARAAYEKEHGPADPAERKQLLLNVLAELSRLETQHGNDHRELLPVLVRLGHLQLQAREHVAAEQSLKRALTIGEHAYGLKSVRLVPALEKMVDLQMAAGRWQDAEATCWRLHDIVQATYGTDSLETASVLLSIGRILDSQLRPAEAEPYFLSALRIREQLLGTANELVTRTLRELAIFWRHKGGRVPERRRIGEILVEAELLTPDRLNDAIQYASVKGIPLGQSLVALQMIEDDDLKKVLQAQLLVGDGVLPLQLAVRALAKAVERKVELKETLDEIGWQTEDLTTDALRTLLEVTEELNAAERALGATHCAVALLSLKLGDCQCEQRRFTEAESSFKRAMAILEQEFGGKDPEFAEALFRLANLYLLQKRNVEAEPLLWQALEIRQQALGNEDIDVALTLERLGDLKCAGENPAMAVNMYRSALAIKETRLGKDSEELLGTLQKLAECYSELDELEQAETCWRRFVSLKQSITAADRQVEVAPALEKLAEIYLNRGNLSNAETQCELAIEIREAAQGSAHADLAPSLLLYARVLRALGREDRAVEMEKRSEIVKRLSPQRG